MPRCSPGVPSSSRLPLHGSSSEIANPLAEAEVTGPGGDPDPYPTADPAEPYILYRLYIIYDSISGGQSREKQR